MLIRMPVCLCGTELWWHCPFKEFSDQFVYEQNGDIIYVIYVNLDRFSYFFVLNYCFCHLAKNCLFSYVEKNCGTIQN
jgi:hypothetical protein